LWHQIRVEQASLTQKILSVLIVLSHEDQSVFIDDSNGESTKSYISKIILDPS